MKKVFFYTILFFVFGCQLNSQNKKYKINKTDSEWKALLPKMSYYVLRKEGTERAFSGSLNFNKNPLKKGSKKLINAWAFYDWANSVYSLVISSAIFQYTMDLYFQK